MVLFRYILIFLLLYFLVNLLGKVLFPKSNQGRVYSRQQGDNYQKREGEININTDASSRKKRIDKDEGEYVKYEEIKEDKKD